MYDNCEYRNKTRKITFLHGPPDLDDECVWLSDCGCNNVKGRWLSKVNELEWIEIQKRNNLKYSNTSSNFSKFWVSNSSLTSGVNAASIWYKFSHWTPSKNGWDCRVMQHKCNFYIQISCNIFNKLEKDTPYDTFISTAPFDPNLWLTLHKSLLIRSVASGDSLASSGNFKWDFQFTICIK